MENIIFEDCDTFADKATKTVQIFAGSNELKKELTKLGVKYTKVEKGVFVTYVLRHKDFENGKIIVKL